MTEPYDVIVDVIPPRNFGNKDFGEPDIMALFESMLHHAGYTGRFSVRAEEMVKGSAGKANTIRFQSRPVGASGMFMLYVTWQCTKPDTAYKGVLLSTEHEPMQMHEQLAKAYPTQTFVLDRDGVPKNHKLLTESSASVLFSDEDKFRRLARNVCNAAEADEHCFITRAQIETIIRQLFPKANWGRGSSVYELLSQRGYLSPYDGVTAGLERTFFVEPALFHMAGLVHPDHRRTPAAMLPTEKETPAKTTTPALPATSGMNALQLLRELRDLRAKISATEGLSQEIESLQEEKRALELEIEKANVRIKYIDRELDEKQKLLNDPEIAEARETLAEFETFLK
jgi:hypothetical protein